MSVRVTAVQPPLYHVMADRSAEYRRQARRLRGQLAARPVAMQKALRELARREDARPDRTPRVRSRFARPQQSPGAAPPRRTRPLAITETSHADSAPAPVVQLAELVRESLCNGVLYYSRRQELLREARQRGIGRFDANLIIAAVQHRHALGRNDYAPSATAPQTPQSRPALSHAWRQVAGLGAIVAGVAVIEAGALLAGWFTFHPLHP